MCLSWSVRKTRILIGWINTLNFAIRTAKMVRARTTFEKLLFQFIQYIVQNNQSFVKQTFFFHFWWTILVKRSRKRQEKHKCSPFVWLRMDRRDASIYQQTKHSHYNHYLGLNWPVPTTTGPLHDPVTWYKITHAGQQVAQRDFQNKSRSRWTDTSCFVLEVPLFYLRPSRRFCTTWPHRAKGLLVSLFFAGLWTELAPSLCPRFRLLYGLSHYDEPMDYGSSPYFGPRVKLRRHGAH